jgi:hypothetical protein
MMTKFTASMAGMVGLLIAVATPAAAARWHGPDDLQGAILETPSCVSWGPNRIDCFARGRDRVVVHRWWDGGGWRGWESLRSGPMLSAPECVSWRPGRLDCFAVNAARGLSHSWWSGGGWSPWEVLIPPGQFVDLLPFDPPSCVSWGPSRIDCFVRGYDRVVGPQDSPMYHYWYARRGWDSESLGGDLETGPDCVSRGSNRIDCVADGVGGIYHRGFSGTSWSGWRNLRGSTLHRPECVSWGADRLDCFVRGTEARHAMWHAWQQDGRWDGWESLLGSLAGSPSCVSWGANRIDCFVRGTDNGFYHRWWNGSSWLPTGGWEFPTPTARTIADPECVSWGPSRIDCFVVGTNRRMYHIWYG